MPDFVNWCFENNLVEADDEGNVTWREAAVKGKCCGHKDKYDGGRDQRDDLSDDYKDYCHQMGTVWPFKVLAKGGKKTAAHVAK